MCTHHVQLLSLQTINYAENCPDKDRSGLLTVERKSMEYLHGLQVFQDTANGNCKHAIHCNVRPIFSTHFYAI